MSMRKIVLLVVLCLLVSLIGCQKAKPTAVPEASEPPAVPTVEATVAQEEPAAAPTAVEPTPTDLAMPTVVISTPVPEGPQGPTLLAPPDGLEATLFDLMWAWGTELGTDEWFELQIWPDGEQPEVYAWLTEKTLRVTSATLSPGVYRWRVVVVKGRNGNRGEELSPYSEVGQFTIKRPSIVAQMSVTPPAAVASSADVSDLPDLGDAPNQAIDSSVAQIAYPLNGSAGILSGFQTVYDVALGQYGPMHLHPAEGAWLGASVTGEEHAQTGLDQDGVNNIDLVAGRADRDRGDDGLRLSVVPYHKRLTRFDFVVSYASGAPSRKYYLNAWFDFDRNGGWGDVIEFGSTRADEWAVQNQAVPYHWSGTYTYKSSSFMSWNLDPEQPMWIRLTLSEVPLSEAYRDGRGPDGGYEYGETEDYYFSAALRAPTPTYYYWSTYTPSPVPTLPTPTPTTIATLPTATATTIPTLPTATLQPTIEVPTATTAPTDQYPIPTEEPTEQPTVPPTTAPTDQYPIPTEQPTSGPTEPYVPPVQASSTPAPKD